VNERDRVATKRRGRLAPEGSPMNAVTRFVAVVFGPYRRESGFLAAPGDADCRWRVAAALEPTRRARKEPTAQDDEDPAPMTGAGYDVE